MVMLVQTPWGISADGGETIITGAGNIPVQQAMQQTISKLAPAATTPSVPNKGLLSNPFTSAMSGTQSGTLQPYLNKLTQQSSDALNGGLLNYLPQSMTAPSAGGTPINSQVPSFNIPSALAGFSGFGNRSWMGK